MNGHLPLCTAALCLSACQSYNGTPVDAYQRSSDRFAIMTGLAAIHAIWPCMRKEKVVGSVATYGSLPDDECYRLEPPRRWRGLLRRTEDGEQFCPEAAEECSYESSSDRTWFYWKTADVLRASGRLPSSGLYYVDVIGRRTAVRGRYGFGHYANEIVVDRLISLKQVEGLKSAKEATLK
jgi:hypothetical protein